MAHTGPSGRPESSAGPLVLSDLIPSGQYSSRKRHVHGEDRPLPDLRIYSDVPASIRRDPPNVPQPETCSAITFGGEVRLEQARQDSGLRFSTGILHRRDQVRCGLLIRRSVGWAGVHESGVDLDGSTLGRGMGP